MKFIAAIAALVVAAVANAQVPFTNCASGPTQIAIQTFSIAPYPLCINQNVCATGTGILNTPVIAGSTLSITGRYLGRLVYTDNHDLCTLMASQGFPCPLPTTMTSITACVLVKPNAPPNIGVALQVVAVNGDGGTLFCQAATVTAKVC
ncbi:hypothetical protein BG015_008229 [Linnemannia schmuckeri]|uniref:Phosphatidylglycerol/phosphatidylinositol transfer protein n=1 Tax=Linnemannia schmuckeri TaxID=64567 RepID=A0A9P5S6H6_9FUNG|nr:hypothetical protein BG015_008229 [Linnemannia schmuckeri]